VESWGDQDPENMTLQQCVDMYKDPLTEDSIKAILELIKVAVDKKKKKSKVKKEKKRAEKINLAAAQDHKVSKKCIQDKGENEPIERKKRERKSSGHMWVGVEG
jgi:hypothetical protein